MPELERLRRDHGPAVLAFELENRAYFARSISDRGDVYFAHFEDRHNALLSDQEAGTCAFYVLVDDDGSVLGRFNLVDAAEGTAELGYRVAQRVTGRGVATWAVRELCRRSVAEHGLGVLKARTTDANVGSRRVLAKVGFLPDGPADVGGRPGTWYRLELDAD